MSTDRDFDRIARAWLDLMPDEAPDRSIAAVLQAVETTPQRRRVLAGPWRFTHMSRFATVGATAIIVATAGFLLFTRPAPDVATPPTASPSTSVAPSQQAGAPLDDELRATWLAVTNGNSVLGSGSGPVSLSVSLIGTGIDATNFGPGHGYASAAEQIAPDQIRVVLGQVGSACSVGAVGVYRWTLSSDRSELTLTTVSEDCSNRGIVFARRWARSLGHATTAGAGVIDSMEPNFKITLPDDSYQARTLDDFIEIGGSSGFSLMAFKNPQPFVDACSTDEKRVPYTPGAAAFIAAFRANEAFEVSAANLLKIDGHDAVHVTIGGKANYARCPGQELYEYTPKACGCHFIVGQGDADSMYLVDVGGDTFMFIVSPFGSASELDAINSIRIPFTLPTQ